MPAPALRRTAYGPGARRAAGSRARWLALEPGHAGRTERLGDETPLAAPNDAAA